MADSLEISKTTGHSRSISLPSTSHSLATAVEEQLQKLRSLDATSSSLASSAPRKLGGLKDLYDCIDDRLQMPLTQKALPHENHRSSMEVLLDGSLKLLDVCGNVKDVFSQMKECIQELESSSWRKRRRDPEQASEVETYIKSRKTLRKMVTKLLDHVRKMERKNDLRKHSKPEATLSILREAEEISFSVFESPLHVLSGPRERSKPISWSLALEMSIGEIEEGMECVFRRLVKTRAALLCIINC
ncbi:hypothetical protein ACJRO7_023674 [Eucalyptus globulus]|uniref:Uncharacterized protein n=1 Tax=Eucalyptus globulus TaxID=34317 RepID=A0ABD3K2P6_EUCGL